MGVWALHLRVDGIEQRIRGALVILARDLDENILHEGRHAQHVGKPPQRAIYVAVCEGLVELHPERV